jgi:hypothetical protein
MSDVKAPEKKAGWWDDIRYVDDMFTKTDKVRVLTYGLSGMGKTKFCGTFPKPFLISTDRGLRTLKALHRPGLEIKNDRHLYRRIIDILIDARDKSGPFAEGGQLADVETIALDGYTELANVLIYNAVAYGAKPRKPEENKPEFDEWNTLKVQLQTITRLSQDIPMNFVATCIARQDKDELSGGYLIMPDIQGSFRSEIQAKFDEVYYFTARHERVNNIDQTIYEAKTKPGRNYVAKSRDDIQGVIQNPTYDTLKKLLIDKENVNGG